MQIKLGLLVPLALGAIVMTGCKKEPSLVGKWNGTVQQQSAVIEFKEDKKVTIDANVGGAKITLLGEYKVDGKNLSMTLKDSKISGVPPQFEAIAKQQVGQALNKENKSTFEFVNEDEVTLTNNGKTESLTRVKDKA